MLSTSALHRTRAYQEGKPDFGIINWQPISSLRWMEQNWHYSVYASAIYLVTIFTLLNVMKTRTPFKLRGALCVWNAALSVFSFAGAYYMLPEMYEVLASPRGSFNKAVCISSVVESAQYWMWLFALSKIVELGDTLFIVLRRQPLIFLHWVHHVSALIYTWYAFGQNISLGRWFVTMNYSVHSLMYGYYALRALQYRIPRPIAMFITTLQIAQMVMGFYVSVYAFHAKMTGSYCEIPTITATAGVFVYTAFFFMFAQFFVKAYLSNTKIRVSLVRRFFNEISSDNIQSKSKVPQTNGHSNGTTPSSETADATTTTFEEKEKADQDRWGREVRMRSNLQSANKVAYCVE